MIYDASPIAVGLFVAFVLFVLGLSFYFARRTKDSKGYFAAGGQIHWSVNGIAFAGDYLSAASFLGIAGMIATVGYDGFLYSIGYLAGWIVALFVVAEPLKRLGKYTFSDALDAKFNSKGIQLTAGISTLVVSLCYLIPQMVGAGALVTPLLGLPHFVGVIMVGAIVIFIVATAGMASTTYVQFLKGGLLIVFSTVMVILVLRSGFTLEPDDYHDFETIPVTVDDTGTVVLATQNPHVYVGQEEVDDHTFVRLAEVGAEGDADEGIETWWSLDEGGGDYFLRETLSIVETGDGDTLYNGAPKEDEEFFQVGHFNRIIVDGEEVESVEGLNPAEFLAIIEDSEIVRFSKETFSSGDDDVTLWYQNITSGEKIMRPGLKFKVDEGSTTSSKLNFVSLMLALFFGTSALPHILIRYYTVPSQTAARKSTIVAIAAIGFFYILTLFMGLGAMINGVLDVESSNMSAPLLAQYFGTALFAIVSAIAFATVLGTVSGLIVASSGAVVHDLMNSFGGFNLSDSAQVAAGKIAAVVVGGIAILLGIYFKGANVSFLVGLAFAVAASANLPAILMLLFWKKTTARGIAASVLVGMVSALVLILLSPSMYERYGVDATAPFPLDNPGIISIPLSFVTLIVVSLLTQKPDSEPVEETSAG
ncbi:MAG: cation acetate symporter [Chloroflexi bacterium]|nr:cation acetate symporter [Chloroflexota bacterium]